MIKVNLLQNTVERSSAEVVETAISSQGTQQVMLLLVTLGACLLFSVGDYVITMRANTRLKAEVQVEEQRAAQLQDLNRQAMELQAKNKAVEDRINAVQRLRAEQIGPVRLLELVDSRLPADTSFRLKSIKQENENQNKNLAKAPPKPDNKQGEAKRENTNTIIAINGYSPSEAQVTAFAKNLEFSNGLFTNFNVETHLLPNPELGGRQADPTRPQGAVVDFVIRCSYNPQTLLTHTAETKEAAPASGATQVAAKAKGR